ncbi:DUF4148 domain-containing protein [Pandoraea nosoerga]|uniref:DUF4148 domain-containing protein n=1 Tax=Pandoraea nosoerga TaxID=2508296 RepID=A0A5E4WCG3_9BURK|nr:DUF4148 domain-containing protein [Pandoraea nosoerga]MBN4665930.1 DUF4148 domain-containing protein [Pandoraea nosoerga]MBN4676104.1 DUF4148 domain-containing protein [Pandoraea nosoerga]MBN4682487.1 DUF4148 domain-containing protein [Pandoraea nosoerga]MBN4745028.1 DUF4148 domain-containing protein [Pandoraea nosoerga]VVE22091.1 hypothetical protein PNO31109_03187 [Pandoraea nosoerga]
MKKNLLSAVALVGLTMAAGSAFAADSQTSGVSREHVRAELQAARELGLSPVTEFNFPYTFEQSVQLQKRTAEIEAMQRGAAPQVPSAN